MSTDRDLELVLVRHGETDWNLSGRVQGHSDEATLTKRGLEQAAHLAEELASDRVRALYSSDLQRARETARPIAERLGLEIRLDSRLRERHLGVLQGGPPSALVPEVFGVGDGYVTDPEAAPEGGESLRDLYIRTAQFLDDLAGMVDSGQANGESANEIVVVSHGGTIRMALSYLSQVPLEKMVWSPVPNGAVARRSLAVGRTDCQMEEAR